MGGRHLLPGQRGADAGGAAPLRAVQLRRAAGVPTRDRAALLLGGLALLAAVTLRPPRNYVIAAHTLSGLALLAVATTFLLVGGWPSAVIWGGLGCGAVLAPLLAGGHPAARRPAMAASSP